MTDRRIALGLGLAASAVALSGRGKARAADALSIDATGVKIDKLEVAGPMKITGGNTLEFGAGVSKQADAGKIGYGVWNPAKDSLNIVGAGTTAENRKIYFFAEGGATFNRSLAVAGALTVNAELKTPAGANMLDVRMAARAGDKHPTGLALYVTADSDPDGKGVEFRHSNGSQGIGFGHNTIYATGSSADQDLILKAKGNGRVRITGILDAKDFAAADANPLRHRMYPEAPMVYQDIFAALNARAIEKIGSPAYDDTSYKGNATWKDRNMIRFGGANEADGNGALVTIPTGYDTVWVRVLGERWNVIHAYFTDGGDLGRWTGGWRSANSYAPDGTLADGYSGAHQWVPIPARRAGKLALISKPNTDKDFWISGLAFSKNPWGHAAQSAVGYHWAVNGGDATGWREPNWNSDSLAAIDPKTKLVLKVPVVPSGRDKLLYLIEHNSNWNGASHTAITVEGKPIERFMATYDNPFSRHWNSKSYERYIATRIPNSYIPVDARYLSVIINTTKQNNTPKEIEKINFREIGTHDLAVPWP